MGTPEGPRPSLFVRALRDGGPNEELACNVSRGRLRACSGCAGFCRARGAGLLPRWSLDARGRQSRRRGVHGRQWSDGPRNDDTTGIGMGFGLDLPLLKDPWFGNTLLA